MPRIWTDEQRAAAAERIRTHKPWEKSTGPRTRAGKKRASQNAAKHGNDRHEIRHVRKALKAHRAFLALTRAFMAQDKLSCRRTNCKKNPVETKT